MSGHAEERFPEHLWAADLLLTLAAGPELLSPETDTGIPAPPDMAETLSELDRLELMAARLRDVPTRDLIRLEAEADPVELLWRAGLIPDRTGAEPLWDLLSLTARETGYFALREKRKYERIRPTQLRPRIGTVVPIPGHSAYPSGHSSQMNALAGVLSALSPSCAEPYRLFAAEVAYRREIAGVHYPSDTRAGEILAEHLVPEILKSATVSSMVGPASLSLEAHIAQNGCEGVK